MGRDLVSAVAVGDILRGAPDGQGGWIVNASPLLNQDNYLDQSIPGTILHETASGGLAQVPGRPEVATTVISPSTPSRVVWIGCPTAPAVSCAATRSSNPPRRSKPDPWFGKANGLGDLEPLCAAAPLEIGNRVWRDSDGDGVQDADEPPLAGITVNLWGRLGRQRQL